MYLICNGAVLTRDPSCPFIEDGAVLIDGGQIAALGSSGQFTRSFPSAERIDARGGVIMPGFINAHTHFYSAFLRGASLPRGRSSSLADLLSSRSWRLDSALTFDDCVLAARFGAVEAARCGVTAVFDHHSSPFCTLGVLSAMAGEIEKVGIRACMGIEASRRCGGEACMDSMHENGSFMDHLSAYPSDLIRASFCLHAPFTLSDEDLAYAASINSGRTGFHIHVSEGFEDGVVSGLNNALPVERLQRAGILGRHTILAHCVHTTPRELDMISETDTVIVNNPITNMFNAVGRAPISEMLSRGITVGMGTDGATSSMPEAARAFIASFRAASKDPYSGAAEAMKLLFDNNGKIASRFFGEGCGVLRPGAPADVIIMDYLPSTRFDKDTADSHIIFSMSGRDCVMTMCAGRLIYKDGRVLSVDEKKLKQDMKKAADALWERMASANEKDRSLKLCQEGIF